MIHTLVVHYYELEANDGEHVSDAGMLITDPKATDFMFEDCGYEGEGLVHFCHCTNCGAEIEYRIPLDDDTCE